MTLRQAKRAMIVIALRFCGEEQKRATARLGVSTRVLNYKMTCHGIPRPFDLRLRKRYARAS